MVEQLLECSSLQSDAGRQILLQILADAFGQRLPVHSQVIPRIQLVEIVMSCAKIPGGLEALVDAVIQLEEETWSTVKLRMLLDEWHHSVPPEQFELFGGATQALPQAAQPTVWGHVPPRNPNFTGRAALLESLHERLGVGTTAVLPEALLGMGGVGKTQLAVEYVYQHQSGYDLIWWIPAERPAQIGQSLSELAQRLNLPVSAEVGAVVPAVREVLRVGDPFHHWLLIFDNAESPEAVRPYFPSGGPGSILVTSRDPRWASVASAIEVSVFTRDESTALLRRRGPDLTTHDADRLADALGDLPLAIEQAAAWRVETGMPADEYLRLLGEQRPELLDDAPPPDYPTTVAAAWNVSLDMVAERNPGALRLLQVCAFLAPEPISRTLFTAARARPIDPALDATLDDPIVFSRAIREINRYALAAIDHRANSIQLHRLVQRVLVDRMTADERETARHAAHLLLAAYDPNQPDSVAQWPRYGELFPHVLASSAAHCGNGQVSQLVYNVTRYLWRWGDSVGSRDLAQHAYDRAKQQLGAGAPETLRIGQWLGFMLFILGRFGEAAELNAATLEIFRETLGEDHENTLDVLQAVAADRRVQGRFAEALAISENVHQRTTRLFGAEDLFTLRAAHNLAVSLRLSGEFRRAYELDRSTARSWSRFLGDDHPDSLYTRLGLIIDQRELGDYAAARAALEILVARHRMLLGEQNFFTLRSVRTLSVTRRKDGDHAGALACAEEARERFLGRYGEDHLETMAATLDLSVDRRRNGDLETARELGTLTHERYRTMFGADHPHTLCAAVNLAATMRLLGDVAGARAIDLTAFEALRAALGHAHVLTLTCALNLASDLFATGDPEAARRHDAETLAGLRSGFGEDHPLTLASAVNLAIDLRTLGREGEALALHNDTVARFERALGPAHPAVQEAASWTRATCDMYPMPL
jgi:hypothetical protein